MEQRIREQKNRYWTKDENGVYRLFFLPFGEEENEAVLSFITDRKKNNCYVYVSFLLHVEHDTIPADSPEDAMEEFEYMVMQHFATEAAYYEDMLDRFNRTK